MYLLGPCWVLRATPWTSLLPTPSSQHRFAHRLPSPAKHPRSRPSSSFCPLCSLFFLFFLSRLDLFVLSLFFFSSGPSLPALSGVLSRSVSHHHVTHAYLAHVWARQLCVVVSSPPLSPLPHCAADAVPALPTVPTNRGLMSRNFLCFCLPMLLSGLLQHFIPPSFFRDLVPSPTRLRPSYHFSRFLEHFGRFFCHFGRFFDHFSRFFDLFSRLTNPFQPMLVGVGSARTHVR